MHHHLQATRSVAVTTRGGLRNDENSTRTRSTHIPTPLIRYAALRVCLSPLHTRCSLRSTRADTMHVAAARGSESQLPKSDQRIGRLYSSGNHRSPYMLRSGHGCLSAPDAQRHPDIEHCSTAVLALRIVGSVVRVPTIPALVIHERKRQ
jgi:hypothetical protein